MVLPQGQTMVKIEVAAVWLPSIEKLFLAFPILQLEHKLVIIGILYYGNIP